MLTNSVGSTQLGQCQHPPVRGGGRRGPGGSGRDRPGPLPALHRAEELGSQFLCLGATPLGRHQDYRRHLPQQPQCRASILPPYAAQLRVGPSSKASSRAEPASSPLTPFLQFCAREGLSRSPRERRSDFRARGFRILGLIN